MVKEKPYRITSVKIKKEPNYDELQIWLELLDNTKKVVATIAGVSIIDNNGHSIESLKFSGGSPLMTASIGASDRHQEYCFHLRLNDATASKIWAYPAVSFFVKIEDASFKEIFGLDT